MDSALPFRPQDTGALLAVTNLAPSSATQPGGPTGPQGDVVYLVYNPASQSDAWIGYGPTSAAAIANAIVPLITAPTPDPANNGGGTFVAPTGTLQGITLVGQQYFAARCQLNSASVWIQPGIGV